MSQAPASPTEPDPNRLASFSDNVLSVAITLLVFNVGVPAGWTHLELKPAIVALTPRLLSFLLSFSVIGVYWVAHNNMFRSARHINSSLLWLNNLFLMMVCLLPASAALLGIFPGQRAAVVIYGTNLLGVGISMRLLWWYVVRLQARFGTPIDPRLQQSGSRRIARGIAYALASIALAWANPWLSYGIFWIAPLSFVWAQLAWV
jgi:uncharacterized membrane protein